MALILPLTSTFTTSASHQESTLQHSVVLSAQRARTDQASTLCNQVSLHPLGRQLGCSTFPPLLLLWRQLGCSTFRPLLLLQTAGETARLFQFSSTTAAMETATFPPLLQLGTAGEFVTRCVQVKRFVQKVKMVHTCMLLDESTMAQSP